MARSVRHQMTKCGRLEKVKKMRHHPLVETTLPLNRSATILTSILFFGSGFAALLYQIAWQRMLFGWYGVDLDSVVSAIISVFMLGLGVGALLGGWLADRFHGDRIFVFSLIELLIGIVGLFSLDFIDIVRFFLCRQCAAVT
jgi:predicted MFS family arabinose efflux permease